MKRLITLLLFGLLALSGCGREMWLKGEVIGRETNENGNLTAIVTETESHGTVRFLLTEDTTVDQLNGEITVEDFLTNDAVYPAVSVYTDANTKTFGSYEGEEIPDYTAILIHLEGGYKTNTKVLADGTTLHIVEKEGENRYELEDGTLLLTESQTTASVLQNLKLEPLYDLSELLETAYAAYKETENPSDFYPYSVSQTISLTASSEKLQYYEIEVQLSTDRNSTTSNSIGLAVDRETTIPIPTAKLFTCPAEEIGTRLLALADLSDADRADMESAFQLENLIFFGDSIRIKFPENSLSSYPEGRIVAIEDTEGIHALLYDWAIPE
ncbi:hypothetical protein [Anaerotignum sp.]|uniref:hypothetical protein n=1 Tax=Anaerotignum sp. TaxID=2039241 RepID=UPI00373658CC